MAAAVGLRTDFTSEILRTQARQSRDAKQARRLLALAMIYDGGSRSDAAKTGGVGLQILRDWVLRFNAEGPLGLVDRKAPGARPKLDRHHREALVQMIESGPIPAVHGVVRWRLVDLVGWLHDEYGISIDATQLGRILKAMGYRRLTARPKHHGQNELALKAFKKTSPQIWQRSNDAFQREPSSKSGSRTKPE
jgi:transposase